MDNIDERTEKIENEIKDLVLGKKDTKELVYTFKKEDFEDEAFDEDDDYDDDDD